MFLYITEDEAVYIMAAISRVVRKNVDQFYDDDFGPNLCEKLAGNLTVGELNWVQKLYENMEFSPHGDPSCSFVELYHNSP